MQTVTELARKSLKRRGLVLPPKEVSRMHSYVSSRLPGPVDRDIVTETYLNHPHYFSDITEYVPNEVTEEEIREYNLEEADAYFEDEDEEDEGENVIVPAADPGVAEQNLEPDPELDRVVPDESGVFLVFCIENDLSFGDAHHLHIHWERARKIPDWLYQYCRGLVPETE